VWARISKPRLVVYLCLFLVPTIVIVPRRHVWLHEERRLAPASAISDLLRDPISYRNPEILLAEANRLAWVFNWPKAEPLYVRAEELFKEKGDTRKQRVGWIRARSANTQSPYGSSFRIDYLARYAGLGLADCNLVAMSVKSPTM
jgi:hypothetical protein